MQVGIAPRVFFIPRILLVPKIFYQCLPILGFFASFSKGPLQQMRQLFLYLCIIVSAWLC